MNRRMFDAQIGRPTTNQRIAIDFLYLDLDVCARCIGTNVNLEAALLEVSQILVATGVDLSVTKTLVESEEQAWEVGFFSSPTIRLNGKDIALEFRESRCESCESCACNGEVKLQSLDISGAGVHGGTQGDDRRRNPARDLCRTAAYYL